MLKAITEPEPSPSAVTTEPNKTGRASHSSKGKKKEKKEQQKKEQDTLEQLIETTQEMEDALKSLEEQNEELNDQLMEKEILLNLAQKELESIKVQYSSVSKVFIQTRQTC
jgi:(p)ppGpp synthase/HD superfamily hydrolase